MAPSEVLAMDLPALERLRVRFPYTAAKLYRNLARITGLRLRDTTAALTRGLFEAAAATRASILGSG